MQENSYRADQKVIPTPKGAIMSKMRSTKKYIIDFYYDQLNRYEKIGIGNESEFGTIIQQKHFDMTELRLLELKGKL